MLSRVLVLLNEETHIAITVRTIGELLLRQGSRDSAAVRNAFDIETAIDGFGAKPHGAVIVLPDPATTVNADRLMIAADRHRLPTLQAFRWFAVKGGLISYGTNNDDLYRRAASYVDRILKGAKPSELPVQNPTKYDLVINLKTAKALGLEVPPTLLGRADEVIE
jgi:putative ABC transport system substrate-binding protein